jgi:peptidoglycan/LPS O-acetylase OafA/YrhL
MPKPVGSSQRYMPGLDGLRAIAVIAVIAYHLDPDLIPGGLLGVGVFFTLSGYLITDLLLGQREATGSLKLGDFWMRRARRLLPALFLMLAVVVAWVTLLDRSQLTSLRGDVLAAVAYVSNWWNIVREASYFARFGPPPPLDHLWSLAVEEQFYLIWPWLLLLGLRFLPGRYNTLALVTLAGAAVSAAAMAIIYQPGIDPTRVYEGTDTRAFGLLVGAALAMVWPSRKLSAERITLRGRLILDGIGVAGLVVIVLLILRTSEYSPSLYKGGIVLLTVATTMTVAALVHPASWLGVAVGWMPLRWIGVRSYGIYLWHYPIIVLTTPGMQQASLGLQVMQVVATVAVAALSWQFFEEPIRRGAIGRMWGQVRSTLRRSGEAPLGSFIPRRPFVTGVVSIVAVGVLAVDCAGLSGMVSPRTESSDLATRSEKEPMGSGVSTHRTVAAPTTTAAPDKTSPEATSPSDQEPERKSSEPTSQEAASPNMSSCNSVAYIGDSTSEGMVLPSFLPNPEQRLGAQYARVGATSQYLEISGARSIIETLSEEQASGYALVRELKANGFDGCWVIALGMNDTANVYVGSMVGLETRVSRMMRVMGDAPVMWITVKTLLDSGP